MAKLEVNNLTISFRTNNGAVRAVRDISFTLNEGETLAIAGESGSGKSVTTRAVMGILAGNAMVDNGEIIYDGKDLLKIPEEEFHTLRGHKLSMVFQDPLSALNPIMRIGKQLTEAMMLNNKERRADGKKRMDSLLKQLEKSMNEVGVANASEEIHAFRNNLSKAVQLNHDYESAQEALIEIQDYLEEMEEAADKHNLKDVKAAASRIPSAAKRSHNEWLLAENHSFWNNCTNLVQLGKRYNNPDHDNLTAAITTLRNTITSVTEGQKPDFFAIGYTECCGKTVKPGDDISALANQFQDNFMDKFLEDTASALQYSAKQAAAAKKDAIQTLKDQLPVFQEANPNQKKCHAAGKKAADSISHAIDPLELEKDNRAYIFHTSINTIDRYFASLKQNPQEEKRFARETVAHDKLEAKGKFAPSPVPKNLIDGDKAKADTIATFENMIFHFEAQLKDTSKADYHAKAEKLVAYLKQCAADYGFTLSKGMARHRAIELMKEVGIPEPHRRFTQYPFEFSGGMRQRIVIAIALSANPDILICDEPTTALDVTIQAQILELINRLKRERKLSVIFITHDLGVVANMADRIAIMYAGKIVEFGTADDVFYDPKHPYTWALLSSMPDLETKEKLEAIPGTPPNMIQPPKGDAFAARNKYAMAIDF